MTIAYETTLAGFPIRLEEHGNRRAERFTVTYGLQVRHSLTYEAAALELGASIMHALAVEGRLSNA